MKIIRFFTEFFQTKSERFRSAAWRKRQNLGFSQAGFKNPGNLVGAESLILFVEIKKNLSKTLKICKKNLNPFLQVEKVP